MPLKDPEKRKAYHRKYMVEYLKDPAKRKIHLKRVARNNRKKREQQRVLIRVFKANGCLVCEEFYSACLVAHHVDPTEKAFVLGRGVSHHSVAEVEQELTKCICLCMNCHAKYHAGDLELVQRVPGSGS